MAKKQHKYLCIVDHANKAADRHRMNPNRAPANRGRFRRDLSSVQPTPRGKPDDDL